MHNESTQSDGSGRRPDIPNVLLALEEHITKHRNTSRTGVSSDQIHSGDDADMLMHAVMLELGTLRRRAFPKKEKGYNPYWFQENAKVFMDDEHNYVNENLGPPVYEDVSDRLGFAGKFLLENNIHRIRNLPPCCRTCFGSEDYSPSYMMDVEELETWGEQQQDKRKKPTKGQNFESTTHTQEGCCVVC